MPTSDPGWCTLESLCNSVNTTFWPSFYSLQVAGLPPPLLLIADPSNGVYANPRGHRRAVMSLPEWHEFHSQQKYCATSQMMVNDQE